MKKYVSNSLLLLVSSPDSSAWNFLEESWFGPYDHILVLSESDFEQPDEVTEDGYCLKLTRDSEVISGPTVLSYTVKGQSHFQRALEIMPLDPLTDFAVIGCGSSSPLLNAILNQAKDSLGAETSTTIVQCEVGCDSLALITEISQDATFDNCILGEGWWLKPSGTKSCERLRFTNCSGIIPTGLEFGQATWEKLTSISIDENVEARHLYPSPTLRCNFGTPHVEAATELTPSIVKAFWSPNLGTLGLTSCKSAEWIVNLPIQDTVSSLELGNTPVSNLMFSWICAHRGLRNLTLAWEKGVRLDWRALAKLKHFRSLNVSATHFDDEDLEILAGSVKLRTLWAYYTSITPACWKFVFRWTSLRSFWASTEATDGAQPVDVPKATALREVVAMNARLEPFESLLARYPNVKLVQL